MPGVNGLRGRRDGHGEVTEGDHDGFDVHGRDAGQVIDCRVVEGRSDGILAEGKGGGGEGGRAGGVEGHRAEGIGVVEEGDGPRRKGGRAGARRDRCGEGDGSANLLRVDVRGHGGCRRGGLNHDRLRGGLAGLKGDVAGIGRDEVLVAHLSKCVGASCGAARIQWGGAEQRTAIEKVDAAVRRYSEAGGAYR